MSNPNKTEINKAYGEMVRNSVGNITNNTAYGSTGLNFNEVASASTNAVSHTCIDNKTVITGNDFKLMDVDTQANRNCRQYDIESLYPKICNYAPSILSMSITKDAITAINSNMKIKDIEIIVPNKVVKVVFNDDTYEKAICHKDDEFNLEAAITVCIAKRLLGGSSKFNNLVTKGLKLYNNKIKAEQEAKKEQERIENKRRKNHEKTMKRIARKEQEARNARIQEQAEAIKLAYEMLHTKPEVIAVIDDHTESLNKK